MSIQLKTPGVYVEEVSTIPSTIGRDSSTVPLFMGTTPRHHGAFGFNSGSSFPTKAVKIGSVAEFIEIYGGQNWQIEVSETTGEPSTYTYVAKIIPYPLLNAIRHYFANGGGTCLVMSSTYQGVQMTSAFYVNSLRDAEAVYGAQLLVLPELSELKDGQGTVIAEVLGHCERVGNRFAILDVLDTGDPDTDASNFRSTAISGNMSMAAAYYPYLNTSIQHELPIGGIVLKHHKDGVAEAGTFNNRRIMDLKWLSAHNIYNGIMDAAKAEIAGIGNLILPPSAAVAGQIVRTDRERGIWKAPANISVNAVIGPKTSLTQVELDNFNSDAATGKSINVIRTFHGRGTMIYGARTMDGNSNEWRYIPVRRLFTMIEHGIKRGSEWAVFEPNDANTWLRLKTMIEIYLTGLWREGALAGAKPSEAFFVRVGLGTTMTQNDILNGILRIDVGVAAVRPAEFIVLRVSQMMQQS